jgi:hypothetical protein
MWAVDEGVRGYTAKCGGVERSHAWRSQRNPLKSNIRMDDWNAQRVV